MILGSALCSIPVDRPAPLLGGFLSSVMAAMDQKGQKLMRDHLRTMFRFGFGRWFEKNTKAKIGDKTMMDALMPGC